MKIEVHVEDLWKTKKKIKESLKIGMRLGLLKAGQMMASEVRAKTPVGVTGMARNSIHLSPTSLSDYYIIASEGVKYYPVIELGSRPHFPPVEALYGWVSKVLGLAGKQIVRGAWAVAVAISQRGTKARYVFKGVYDRYKNKVPQIVKEYLDMIA